MLSRVDPIPLTQRKRTRERLIGTLSVKVIKATRVLHPMPLKVLNLISQPSNREVSPSRTRLLVQKNLVLIVEFMVIIPMSFLFYRRCGKYGKLKQHLEDHIPPLLLLLLLHLNPPCLPILSLYVATKPT